MLALIMAIAASSNTPSFFRGSDIYELCRSSNEMQKNSCEGYIAGAIDSYQVGKGDANVPSHICTATGVTLAQTKYVVLKWLSDHPADRARSAAASVATAMEHAFPCQTPKP